MKHASFCAILLVSIIALCAQAPQWSFSTEPTLLTGTYYDYAPGGYNHLPVQIQRLGDADDNNVYIIYHAQPEATDLRNVYISYIAPGAAPLTYLAGLENTSGGHPSIDLDPETLNPFFAWHSDYNGDSMYETWLRVDRWHENEEPGDFTTPIQISYDPGGDNPDQLWPTTLVGPSPIDDEHRRVYVFTRESTFEGNVLRLARTDFTTDDIETDYLSSLHWTFQVIPQFQDWADDPDIEYIAYCELLARDSILVVSGYIEHNGAYNDELFMLVNRNYGDGDWETYTSEADQTFIVLDDIFFMGPQYTHFTSCEDGFGHIHMPLVYTLKHYEGASTSVYPSYSYIRDINLDLDGGGIAIENLFLGGEQDEPYFPTERSWPVYYPDADMAFLECNFKITGDPDHSLLCAVWSDGLNAKLAAEQDTLPEWLGVPEIAIAVSTNNGDTWSEPLRMNALETPELDGMIPCYVYPGDTIEYLGDGIGRVHLFFLDDNSFGSYVNGNGENLGGQLMYAAIDIDFGDVGTTPDPIPAPQLDMTNSPNPFNPSTTISYSLPADGDARLAVYNILGQRVKTLASGRHLAGEHAVAWNGQDDNGRPVGSGVYFAQLTSQGRSMTRKLLLLK